MAIRDGRPFNLFRWSRRSRVLAADPGREFAFVTKDGGRESTVWRYRFEPVEGGTRVAESYEVRWIPLWARIIDIPAKQIPRVARRHAHTLEQLKSAAEAVSMSGT